MPQQTEGPLDCQGLSVGPKAQLAVTSSTPRPTPRKPSGDLKATLLNHRQPSEGDKSTAPSNFPQAVRAEIPCAVAVNPRTGQDSDIALKFQEQ